MDAEAFVEIGRVAKTHGLKGEVSVIVTVDLPFDRLEGIDVWFVPPPRVLRSSRIRGVRSGPKGPLFSLEGVDDVSTAAALRGCRVLAHAGDLPEIEEALDVIGYSVEDRERGPLGVVIDVIATGANDVWVIDGPFGQVLIPVIGDVVREIDVDRMVAHVTLLPGLIEEGR